ncbi:YfiR family protein [Marivirga salinae]|uniref:YfiR family protein n=1 Tax=Marivirga salinarum TaxID=3059078 RepID=A0AA49J8Z1_9BACT|nr:YfiR family protein [Marivirga sp. BDSF4-3]WKK77937.2 YfiR family protein [Marivirga sp. BDSF4-3]
MKRISRVLLVIAIMVFGFNLKSGDRPMHEIHSMLMFNFIKYVEWPTDAKAGNFVIAVVGDEDVASTIQNFYTNRTVKGQTVKVVNVDDVSAVNNAHVLYISSNKSREFDEAKEKFAGKSTLMITDKSGLGKKGSCINFQEINGKLKFEINQASIKGNNLKVSTQLSSMGILI